MSMFKKVFMLLTLTTYGLLIAQEIPRYCTSKNGKLYLCGRDQQWWERHYPGAWARYQIGSSATVKPNFTDLSEQADISGFERGIYNSPK